MKPVHIYARGKLLITGEYLVLHGAKAFSLPLKFGQHSYFHPSETNEKSFDWISYEMEKEWFSAKLDSQSLEIIEGEKNESGRFVTQLLKAIKKIKPEIRFEQLNQMEHRLDFNKEWGFGSSSTLIFNMATWAGINPFELHFAVSKGSGYDIAAADASKPYFYEIKAQKPKVELIDWDIAFKNQLMFVYSGQKQRSDESIQKSLKNEVTPELIEKVSLLTEKVRCPDNMTHFIKLIFEHEQLIGQYLNMRPIQEEKFADFGGAIKSLGAWGGDFLLAASKDSIDKSIQYFKEKGYHTYFTYADLIYE